MGWFNGLSKEEDGIVEWLVELVECAYGVGLKNVTTERTNILKAIFTQNVANTTWEAGAVKQSVCDELKSDIEYLTTEDLIYSDEHKSIILKALNDVVIELEEMPEGMIVEYGRFWHDYNTSIRKNYIQACGKYRYKKFFEKYFK